MEIMRAWAMPSHRTFSIPPIKKFIAPYTLIGNSIDPFARDSDIANITNDLNCNTRAQFHMPALEFIENLEINPDLVLFDPPYSLRQVKECYDGVGLGFTQNDSQNAIRWTKERNALAKIMPLGSIVLSFGWSSSCMGKKRGYEITEILLVAHGGAHNDTICVSEIKRKPSSDTDSQENN